MPSVVHATAPSAASRATRRSTAVSATSVRPWTRMWPAPSATSRASRDGGSIAWKGAMYAGLGMVGPAAS